jgi:predicted MFS family arabinose efflux permease
VFTVLPLLAWDNWSMGAALAIDGLAIAPASAISYELIARTARPDTVTEAFSWAITVNIAGFALGAQLGGLLISPHSTWAAFLAAIVAMLVATAIAFTVRRRFAHPADTSQAAA